MEQPREEEPSTTPYACLPGGGWGIVESNKVRLKAAYYQNGVSVNYILAKEGPAYQVMLHWYQSEGHKVISGVFSRTSRGLSGKSFTIGTTVRLSGFPF